MTNYHLDSLERLANVLEYLGQSSAPRSLKEIAAHTEIASATLYRLLTALDAHGFVRKNPRTRRYVLGPRIFAIGAKRNAVGALRRHTAQFLRRLANDVDGVAQLGSLEGSQVVIDLQFAGAGSPEYPLAAGDYCDAHALAIGKLLLAYCSEAKFSAIFRHRALSPHTSETTTDIEKLCRSFSTIRRQRWALEEREYHPRLSSLAAPLMAPSGRVNHAIAITTRSQPMAANQDEILEKLLGAVAGIQKVVLKQ